MYKLQSKVESKGKPLEKPSQLRIKPHFEHVVKISLLLCESQPIEIGLENQSWKIKQEIDANVLVVSDDLHKDIISIVGTSKLHTTPLTRLVYRETLQD